MEGAWVPGHDSGRALAWTRVARQQMCRRGYVWRWRAHDVVALPRAQRLGMRDGQQRSKRCSALPQVVALAAMDAPHRHMKCSAGSVFNFLV
jgi:hypothetical protein